MAEAGERTCYRHPERVTGLSCSECGRPICTECMTPAPVGLRCPDHSGKPQGAARVVRTVQRAGYEGTGIVTRLLIGINIAVWALEFVQTGQLTVGPLSGSSIFNRFALWGPFVQSGDWWRLITAAFLHYGPFHLAMNMYALYFVGTPLERRLGAARFLLLYLVAGIAGSAGALVDKPLPPTVGASVSIFGILGAAFVLERQRDYVFG